MKAKYTTPRTFAEWQAFSRAVREASDRIRAYRLTRAFALAATVGLPADGCCIHNAACDVNLTGWCHGNPQRLHVAKRVNHELKDWRASEVAGRVSSRAWNIASDLERDRGFAPLIR